MPPLTDNTSDHARLALQPREVKFCDLAPSFGRRVEEAPPRGEKRGFRPAPQKTVNSHGVKTAKTSLADGFEAESGDDEERRRGRRKGGPLDVGAGHNIKPLKVKTTRLSKTFLRNDRISTRIEISGSAFGGEDYGVSAVSALTVLGNCVTHERRLKEELVRVHTAKMLAFRSVISVYLASVKHCGKPPLGRRKAGAEFALAQCAVVAQTLILTIQSYIRAFQSRGHTAVQRCLRYNELYSNVWSTSSVEMPHLIKRDSGDGRTLSETTSSLQELLDEEEISRLKQLYFDYYDCDVYVIPGTRPESAIPPNALLLESLSAHDPFLLNGEGVLQNTSLSTSSASSSV